MSPKNEESSSTAVTKNVRRIRTHQKSRAGCYTCKGRRVKCCETRPVCANCVKAGLQCIYPESQPKAISIGLGRVQYQSRGFDLKDMRFFHNYMTTSWPHLPLDSTDMWKREMPLLAQEHEFLMHALLAVGASHIHARTGRGIGQTVDRHRRLAMKGIIEVEQMRNNTDLAPEAMAGKLNAALASCYALTFVSSYMYDPFWQWLILCRSCASFTIQLWASGHRSSFLYIDENGLSETKHLLHMESRLFGAQPLNPFHVAQAQAAMAEVKAYCTFSPIEQQLFDRLQSTLDNVDNPYESYRVFVKVWTLFVEMSPEDVTAFIDPKNINSNILQAYFLAIEAIMRPWANLEFDDKRYMASNREPMANHREPMALVSFVNTDAPDAEIINHLLEWPASVVEGLAQGGYSYVASPAPTLDHQIEEVTTAEESSPNDTTFSTASFLGSPSSSWT